MPSPPATVTVCTSLAAMQAQDSPTVGGPIIRAVARGIEDLLNRGEIVGRLHGRGGDEFVCLLDETTQDGLERRCRLLEATLDRAAVPPEIASSYLGVSIGAALANGSTGPGLLFTEAESSMRQRKAERKRSQGRPSGREGVGRGQSSLSCPGDCPRHGLRRRSCMHSSTYVTFASV